MLPERVARHRREQRIAHDSLETSRRYRRFVRMGLRLKAEHKLASAQQIIQWSQRFAVQVNIDPAVVADDQIASEIGPIYRVSVSIIDRQKIGKDLRNESAIGLISPESVLVARVV